MLPYTRRGDEGNTDALGSRMPKDSDMMEAIGAIDELSALLGKIASEVDEINDVNRIIGEVMNLNAHIASQGRIPLKGNVDWLERRIDDLWKDVGDLNHFILRFTDRTASEINVARAVCRRAERRIVRLSKGTEWLDRKALAYINRLSDYLFALARWVNKKKGGKEIPWVNR